MINTSCIKRCPGADLLLRDSLHCWGEALVRRFVNLDLGSDRWYTGLARLLPGFPRSILVSL